MSKIGCRNMILVVGALLVIIGCAAKIPPPVDKIAQVEREIQRARESGADIYAPLDLKLAEEKLAEAKDAMAKEKNDKAAQKAEEALTDAQVAEAKSRAAKEKKRTEELQESVDTLRQEIKRTK